MKNNEMVKFYYFRDEKNRPRITRCIIRDEFGNIGIGTAICSKQDNPNKKTGKGISLGRAIKTLKNNSSYSPVSRDKANMVIYEVMNNINEFVSLAWKGLFIPKYQYGSYLSEYEKQLINI